ncbi:hypothetical protein FRC03_012022 [Tulasnella sp. 419]|nr:hypothetical protein FRC03_012022 [Tulasnella sp. 419]
MSRSPAKPGNNPLEREIAQLRQELQAEKEDRIRRDTELESLRKFANAHDKSHGSDVTTIVEAINNEATSFAREVAENWQMGGPKGDHREDNVLFLNSNLPAIVQALEKCSPQHRLSRRVFQIAIQTYILAMSQWILERTCFGLDDPTDAVIQKLRNMIFHSESQPTFARWRALTQIQLQMIALTDREKHIAALQETVLTGLCGLGSCLTGRSLSNEDLKELQEEINVSVKEIILNSIRLGDMLSTDIVSANYSCISSTGHQYDPDYMEMPHGTTAATREDVVAATTRLGMTRVEKLGRETVEGVRELRAVHLKAQVLTHKELMDMVKVASSLDATQPQSSIEINLPSKVTPNLSILFSDSQQPKPQHKRHDKEISTEVPAITRTTAKVVSEEPKPQPTVDGKPKPAPAAQVASDKGIAPRQVPYRYLGFLRSSPNLRCTIVRKSMSMIRPKPK